MEKPRESYLLFDTEPAAYQVKEGDDPTVRKFNRPQSVGMTRREFRGMNKNGDKRAVLDRSLEGMIEEGSQKAIKWLLSLLMSRTTEISKGTRENLSLNKQLGVIR